MPNKMRPGHGERAKNARALAKATLSMADILRKLFEPTHCAIDIVGKHFGFNLIDHDRMSWAAREFVNESDMRAVFVRIAETIGSIYAAEKRACESESEHWGGLQLWQRLRRMFRRIYSDSDLF